MHRFLPVVFVAACIHNPRVKRDIEVTALGLAITAGGVAAALTAVAHDDDSSPFGSVMILGGGVTTIVGAILIAVDAARDP